MDTRLQEALDFSNYRLTLSTQLDNLKIKLKSDLLFTYQNAIFKADINQINYCKTLMDSTVTEFPFEDVNGTPVLITNIGEFFAEMNQTYQRSMIAFYKEYNAVAKSRNIKKIVDYNG
jgi:hypothetical protein